jgi:hypothetical protein
MPDPPPRMLMHAPPEQATPYMNLLQWNTCLITEWTSLNTHCSEKEMFRDKNLYEFLRNVRNNTLVIR